MRTTMVPEVVAEPISELWNPSFRALERLWRSFLAGPEHPCGTSRDRKRIFLFFSRIWGGPFKAPRRAYPVLFGCGIRTCVPAHLGEALGVDSWPLWLSFGGHILELFEEAGHS